MPPQHTCGAHVRPQQEQCIMLPYCLQSCKRVPPSPPRTWQGRSAEARRHYGHRRRVTVVWHTPGCVRLLHSWCSQHAAGETPVSRPAPHRLVIGMNAPRQHAVGGTGWTSPPVCRYDNRARTFIGIYSSLSNEKILSQNILHEMLCHSTLSC